MPSDKTRFSFETKVRAVEMYLATGKSLRKTAQSLSIPYQTLWEWVQLYKQGGKDNLSKKRLYKKRIPRETEQRVMYLKENNPSLSIRRAQNILRREGIILSHKGIWQIWKRYGYTKRSIEDPLCPFCDATPELREVTKYAETLIQEGNFKGAATILNELPCLSEKPILDKVPEKYLSPRRRLDRLYLELGKLPFPEFIRKIRQTGKLLDKKGFTYSSIIADFLELTALGWAGRPKEVTTVLDRLARKMKYVKNSALWFLFYFNQALVYCYTFKISKAIKVVSKCRKLMYVLPQSYYQSDFGTLLAFLGRYKDAMYFQERALENENNPVVAERYALRIALLGHGVAGEYEDAKRMLTRTTTTKECAGLSTTRSFALACISFGQGKLDQARDYYREALNKASRGELYTWLYGTSVGLASVALALNKKTEARMYLKKYLPLMKKCRFRREVLILKLLLGLKISVPREQLQMPTMRLLDLFIRASRTLEIGDYRRAFNFAQRQKLLGIFHRWAVFFPGPIINLLERGKQTGLPKVLLKFPIFNQNIPVYHVEFLGDTIISKNQQHVRIKTSPQETAFLIYLALKAGAPGKFILLNELSEDFWTKSAKPLNRLLHLLAELKKKLMLPRHRLSISSAYGEPRLINRGIYITTDYDEFQTLLTQVKSLERANEWLYAQRDYLRAFTLIRGEPFKKMYDRWSERMRGVILNRIEAEAIHFAQGCMKHNDKEEAKRVLEKVSAIIPHSRATRELLAKL